jgi:hypothetical protein
VGAALIYFKSFSVRLLPTSTSISPTDDAISGLVIIR